MSEPGMNQPSAHDGEQPHIEPVMSPGARLAAYRQERGWTIEQVASQLNLAPRQITALESDNYPALPGMPIVRGFIRAYAKLLKVDATPLIASLGSETVQVNDSITPRNTLSMPFSETRLPTMMERPGLSSKWIFGGLLILLLGVAIWATQQSGELPAVSGPVVPQAKDESTGSDANQQTPTLAGSEIPRGTPAPAIVEPATPTDAANATSAMQAKTPQVVAQPPAKTVPTGKNTLLLKVREDSWIEIRRASSNSASLSRIVKAGETETFEVIEPVSIVIGNAAGVDAILRGTPVELKASTNSNVARLNLK